MIIAAISDLHGMLPWQPPPEDADIIIIAGDVCPNYYFPRDRMLDSVRQTTWLGGLFNEWVDDLGKPVYGTWGNHDFVGQELLRGRWTSSNDRCLIEADHTLVVDGVKFYFTPWVPNLASWAFSFQDDVPDRYRLAIPDDTDVLVSHGPPLLASDAILEGEHVGSETLRNRITQLNLKAVICGHIHEGRGASKINDTFIYNVASVNRQYQPYPQPWTSIVV